MLKGLWASEMSPVLHLQTWLISLGLLLSIIYSALGGPGDNVDNTADIKITVVGIEKSSRPTASNVWLTAQYSKGSEAEGGLQIVDGVLDIPASFTEFGTAVLSCNASCPIQWRFFPVKVNLRKHC